MVQTARPRPVGVVLVLGGIALLALSAFLLFRPEQAPTGARGGGDGFDFGIIGDAPYSAVEEGLFENLIQAMNQERLAFVLHVGDIQSGRCTDDVLFKNLRRFNAFEAPLVYTPGDNEWTDCHRGGADPAQRLLRVREVFFSTDRSLGSRTLPLIRQSEAFPENARFSLGGITVASIHVVGSNNNLPAAPGEPGDEAEFRARTGAALEWLAAAFAEARASRSAGLVVFMQADPRFELPPEERTGFNDVLAALDRETAALGRPVVLVHGDTHRPRVDAPMLDPDGKPRPNFTRVESFGSPQVHWVRGKVDSGRPDPFSFRLEVVEENRILP